MRIAFLLGLLAFCGAASAASFDCNRARSSAEKVVCSNPELSDLDDTLGRYYSGAMAALRENGVCLREDQQRWLGAKRAPCNGPACLREVYLQRLAELYAIQPGINAQRQLALPAAPSIVWVMGPQPEESAIVQSRAAWIEGEVRYDEGLGAYVVRTSEGKPYVLLADILRGGANEDHLASLSKPPVGGYKIAARGRVADDGGRAVPFFDHRFCTFIYRLP
jgi:uncharacterized protein